MANLLITGAAGFLGSHLAEFIKSKDNTKNFNDWDVTLLDIAPFDMNEYGGWKFIFSDTDVRDRKNLEQIIKKQDFIIHCAAALPLWKPKDIFSTNVDGTTNVLEFAHQYNLKKVIHISSTAVYGVPKVHPIDEDAPLVGVGAYGESKVQAEMICKQFIQKGLNLTVLRPKSFIGTRRLGVFEILFDWIHDGKKIPIIGNGKNQYQLLDVCDLTDLIFLVLNSDKKNLNDFFNVGTLNFETVEKDLCGLFDYAESGSKLFRTPALPTKLSLKVFEKLKLSPLYQWIYDTADKDSYVSIEKIMNITDWKPKYSNKDTLIRSYQWYLDNYENIKSRGEGLTHTVGWKQGILKLAKKFM